MKNLEQGSVNPLLIVSIILGLTSAGFAGGFFWAYGNFVDQRDNTDSKIAKAVTVAKTAQSAEDLKQFLEREKQPYERLVGPDDLGSVSINYPKTWSVYIAKNGLGGSYEAYLNPVSVPLVSSTQPFATRITIDDKKYETTVQSYEPLVKKGDLKSTPVTVNTFTGVRLDGKFTATRTGSQVIFKVRDKTLIVASDADAFQTDFNDIIVKSLDFNP